jgi:hypothetical protein
VSCETNVGFREGKKKEAHPDFIVPLCSPQASAQLPTGAPACSLHSRTCMVLITQVFINLEKEKPKEVKS